MTTERRNHNNRIESYSGEYSGAVTIFHSRILVCFSVQILLLQKTVRIYYQYNVVCDKLHSYFRHHTAKAEMPFYSHAAGQCHDKFIRCGIHGNHIIHIIFHPVFQKTFLRADGEAVS